MRTLLRTRMAAANRSTDRVISTLGIGDGFEFQQPNGVVDGELRGQGQCFPCRVPVLNRESPNLGHQPINLIDAHRFTSSAAGAAAGIISTGALCD